MNNKQKKVLVTGGAGYIGSTICTTLIENGHVPVILDSLVNGRIEFTKDRIFYKGDIEDSDLVKKIFEEHSDIECVIHCAALIVVSESMEKPYEYYTENVAKSTKFFKTLAEIGCKKIIFSSSASIYGNSDTVCVDESCNICAQSPYARTKHMMEMVMEDYCNAYEMKGIALRYFNPIGADPELRTGSYIKNPSHVLGKMLQASNGEESIFYITGTNWDTRDGSGIRDYIHVWDLAKAHLHAIENIDSAFEKENMEFGYMPINVGRGEGITVKELVQAFENVHGSEINKEDAPPRPGDVVGAYAKVDKAFNLLNWKAELTVEDGIRDAIRWDNIRDKKLNYN